MSTIASAYAYRHKNVIRQARLSTIKMYLASQIHLILTDFALSMEIHLIIIVSPV
jgi:hypothetical protein